MMDEVEILKKLHHVIMAFCCCCFSLFLLSPQKYCLFFFTCQARKLNFIKKQMIEIKNLLNPQKERNFIGVSRRSSAGALIGDTVN